MTDLVASIVASLVLMGLWLCVAGPVAYLAHRRMRRVEAELGAPALPPNELPLLLMAVASFAWPVAAGVALVAWALRRWARLGRDVTAIALGQLTALVLSASVMGIWSSLDPPRSTREELVRLVAIASANVGVGALIATPLLWLWAGRRAARLRIPPPRAPPPGAWRFAAYALSLVFWPLGVLLAVMLDAPENAHVGAGAFRCSLLQITAIALAVCIAFPLLAQAFMPS